MRRFGNPMTASMLAVLALITMVPRATAVQMPDTKRASGSISGTVVKDGEPAARVGLLIANATPGPFGASKKTNRTQSERDGGFRFDGLEPGSYRIDAYTPGAFTRGSGMGKESTLVTVGEGEAVDNVTIELESGGVITGRIVDTDGKPVAGEAIHVYLERDDDVGEKSLVQFSSEFESDDRGIYRAYGLSPGRYAIGVGDEKTGFGAGGYELSFHGGATEPDSAKRIAVESGSEARDVDVVVRSSTAGFTIVGRVLDAETRKPITNVRIYCGPIWGGQMQGFSGGGGVREDGEFSIEARAPGTYGVLALATEADAGSFYADPIEVVVSDRNVTGVEVAMQRGSTISGVVVPIESDPGLDISAIQSGSIVLQPRAEPGKSRRFGFATGQMHVKPDMTFRSTGLRPGEYAPVLRTFSSSTGLYVARVEMDGAPLTGPIRIGEPVDIKSVRIVLARASAVLRGRVVVRNASASVDRAWVQFMELGSNKQFAFSLPVDAKGVFQMVGAPPGEFEATAIAARAGMTVMSSEPVSVSIGTNGTVEVTIELDLGTQPAAPKGAP